jgi:RNA polymerase sigma-70 factor, ECF subfamily
MDLQDPQTFARVYDEHADAVQATAVRILGDPARAQDVAQDVFLRLWRNPARFDPARGPLGAYLRLMARSRALDLWREAQAAGRAGDRLRVVAAREEEPVDLRPEAWGEREGERAAVRTALATLPPPQREALVLAYWAGLTSEEIARRASIPLGTAKSRIRLGMARLRAELGEREAAPVLAAAA